MFYSFKKYTIALLLYWIVYLLLFFFVLSLPHSNERKLKTKEKKNEVLFYLWIEQRKKEDIYQIVEELLLLNCLPTGSRQWKKWESTGKCAGFATKVVLHKWIREKWGSRKSNAKTNGWIILNENLFWGFTNPTWLFQNRSVCCWPITATLEGIASYKCPTLFFFALSYSVCTVLDTKTNKQTNKKTLNWANIKFFNRVNCMISCD